MCFSLYLDALGYAKSTIGILWAVSVVVEIVWFFTQSRWLPRWPLTGWLLVCAAAMALRMGMTAAGGEWWAVLCAAQVLHALTFAAHHTACIALLSQFFPGRLRGRGQALYSVLAYGLPGCWVPWPVARWARRWVWPRCTGWPWAAACWPVCVRGGWGGWLPAFRSE